MYENTSTVDVNKSRFDENNLENGMAFDFFLSFIKKWKIVHEINDWLIASILP